MSKKDFIALADTLRMAGHMPAAITRSLDAEGIQDTGLVADILEAVAVELADFCASQNPRFNRDRWIKYIKGECGKGGGKVKA